MKSFLGVVVVLLIVAGVAGYKLGWFGVGAVKDDGTGKSHVTVSLDEEKAKHDLEAARKAASDKIHSWSKAVKEKAQALRDKVKELKGDAKSAAEKELEKLSKDEEKAAEKVKKAAEATKDELKELEKGLEEKKDDKKD